METLPQTIKKNITFVKLHIPIGNEYALKENSHQKGASYHYHN